MYKNKISYFREWKVKIILFVVSGFADVTQSKVAIIMAEEIIEIHRECNSEHRKNSGTSTENANNINLIEKINENESERSVDGENNNEERVLTKTANSKVFLTKIFPRRPLSLPVSRVSDVNHNLTIYLNDTSTQENGNNEERREKRKTFHQDVEEALNSLLWQPYEYQNKRTFSDSSSFSLSYTSCSSSLSSLDLGDYNNGSSVERVGNVAMDLHLVQEEMVNNLSLNRCDQSEEQVRSRERRKASRLSGCRTTVSECCAAVECREKGACDDFGSKCDMRLEIPPSSINSQDGNSNNNCYQRSISTGNLSSANVVGLPPRQASMPPPGNGIMFPNHPRNASEPLQFRYNQATVPPPPTSSTFNHQRHNSHVDTTANVQQNVVQHMRSASVPKNMQPQKVGESNAKMINEGLQRALNVSNVNVNFYRAVPVNVVSSVPTIQCVNSSNDIGNNVSNVHIMPLSGSSLPTHNNSTITTVPSMSFSTTVTGTTQVSVHNTQVPSYNIQVPTNTVQVQQSCSNAQVQTCTQPVVVAPPKRLQPTTVPETRTRTFTSTEAQTDEISVCSPPTTSDNTARERRRERRRQQRRLTNNNSTNTTTCQINERLPDILNSHMPPPYSPPVPQPPPQVLPPPPHPSALVQPPPLVPNIVPSAIVGNAILPYPPQVVPGQVPLVQATATPMPVPVTATASGFRFPFPANGFRR